MVAPARGPAGGVSLAAGGRPGADRRDGGGPGGHDRVRRVTCTWHTFLTGRPPASWSGTSFRRVAVLKVTHSSVRWHLNSQSRKKVTVAGDGLRLVLGGAADAGPSGLPAGPVTRQHGSPVAFQALQGARRVRRTSYDNAC